MQVSPSSLPQALQLLATPGFGPAHRRAVAEALSLWQEEVPDDFDDLVNEFILWLAENPQQLSEARRGASHSPLTQLGLVFRRFSGENGPGTPVFAFRKRLLKNLREDDRGWFIVDQSGHVNLQMEVAAAMPRTLIAGGDINNEALMHAIASVLNQETESAGQSGAHLARTLLDAFPDTLDARGPDGQFTAAANAPAHDPWDQQHAAQLLCRFTHEELILIAGYMRGTAQAQTATRLKWTPGDVKRQTQKAWDRMETYLGRLEHSTGQSAETLIRLVEEVLLNMDV